MDETQTTKEPKKSVPFFPASYLIMTVTSLAILATVSWLGASLIDYWINGTSGILADLSIIYWIASLVILVPLHLWSYGIVRRTDRSRITPFSIRIAHGLLGVYLLTTVVTSVILGAGLIAIWLNVLVGIGSIDKHLLTMTLALVQAIVWYFYATFHFTRVRSDHSRPKYYVITLSVLSAVLIILSFVFPVPAYRDIARDFVKETNLGKIKQSVNDYVDVHGNLPDKLTDLNGVEDVRPQLSDYQFAPKGGTQLGIFAYELCTTFAKSNEKGRDIGFGFSSHGSGKQCFTRIAISGSKLQQGLEKYVEGVENGAVKLQQKIRNFLVGAKNAVDQEISGVENFASGQVKQLEGHLEGLEGGTVELQKEMGRLEGNLNGLEGNTGQLTQDFTAVEEFVRNLLCGLGLCNANSN